MKDLTSGYKAFTRRALETIDFANVRSNGYSFQIEMTYRALRKGMTVEDVEHWLSPNLGYERD